MDASVYHLEQNTSDIRNRNHIVLVVSVTIYCFKCKMKYELETA